jgi:O-antigen/teichoic acid export membrane protein
VAVTVAVGLLVFARPLLGFVYGDSFEGAATSLRLLLPGAVLFAGSSIISAGVYAAGRPFTATVPQLLGMAVTVIGLFAFLGSGGVTAAAIVSSASYTVVFLTTLVAYRAVTGLRWRDFLPTPARLRALASGPQ